VKIFFFKILWFTICFFIIFDILFSILSTCQKIREILCFFFILWNRDFIKEFWKIIECFSENYTHLTFSVLYCLAILVKIFCIVLFEGIQILSTNSGNF